MQTLPNWRGSFVAMVTPFRDGTVDEQAFGALLEWHLEKGTQGIVVGGTTGESATLSTEEFERILTIAVKTINGKLPVLAGTGANDTQKVIARTQRAAKLGADGALIVTPYYNKPMQPGLYAHYKAIHDATDLPIMLYNVPGRTSVSLEPETIGELSELERIVAIKDAHTDLGRVARIRVRANNRFVQFAGDDLTALAYNAMGGVGCVSVTANVAPALCADMQDATLRGDLTRARQVNDRLAILHDALMCETNPGPVKFALSLMNKCQPDLRLPLAVPSVANQRRIRDAMLGAGLI